MRTSLRGLAPSFLWPPTDKSAITLARKTIDEVGLATKSMLSCLRISVENVSH